MHKVLVNRLGGLSLPRKSVVRLTDPPDMTLDVYRGCKTATQQQRQYFSIKTYSSFCFTLQKLSPVMFEKSDYEDEEEEEEEDSLRGTKKQTSDWDEAGEDELLTEQQEMEDEDRGKHF